MFLLGRPKGEGHVEGLIWEGVCIKSGYAGEWRLSKQKGLKREAILVEMVYFVFNIF